VLFYIECCKIALETVIDTCCQISLPDGALDCWVFLTCIEILDICAKSCNNVRTDGSPLLDTYSNHVAAVYDCARNKVRRNGIMLTLSTSDNLWLCLYFKVRVRTFS